jgi:hypothetical protein
LAPFARAAPFPVIAMMTVTPKPADRRTYTLVFRPEPECTDAIKALRWLLKVSKRDLKLRCVAAQENLEEERS